MKIIVEEYNSVNFQTKIRDISYFLNIKKFDPFIAFSKTKEGKQSGIAYSKDGLFFGWPNTGYDRLAYRIKQG